MQRQNARCHELLRTYQICNGVVVFVNFAALQGARLTYQTILPDNESMTGNEFIRKVKALGKHRGIDVSLNASRGKGSHQTLYFGLAFTVVRNPKDELMTGTLHAMCAQIGIKTFDL